MTKPARPKKEIDSIKETILASALAILSEEGYGALTMRKIAAKTGMTAANIYNYFHGKDDIYLELVIQGFGILHGSLKAAVETPGAPPDRVRAIMDAYYGFSKEFGQHYDIMFTLPTPKFNDFLGTDLEEKARVEMDLSDKIVAMLTDAVADIFGGTKGFSRDEAALRMIEAWTLIHGLVSLGKSRVLQYVASDADAMYARMRDEMLALLESALGG
jgi:AcrR family transcriptional regulator